MSIYTGIIKPNEEGEMVSHSTSKYNDHILNYRPKHLDSIEDKGAHQFVYNRGGERKTAYIHYVDGMESWEYNPALWKGWKLCARFVGEKEVF